MRLQTNEISEGLASVEAHELAAYLFDELTMSEQEASDIRAGGDLIALPQPPRPCPGCSWGGPVTNHNETVTTDEQREDAAAMLTDLALDERNDAEIFGGTSVQYASRLDSAQPAVACLGGVGTGSTLTLNHNETVAEDEACSAYAFADLDVAEDESIKGGVTPGGTGKTLSSSLLGKTSTLD